MISGIYKLTFKNGMTYIGKSIDIQRRWGEHFDSFKNGKAASKLQHEFSRSGFPDAEVLQYCHKDHLDILETYLIAWYKPQLNTRIDMPISDSDYQEIMRQPDLLTQSTVEHIKFIDRLVLGIEELEDKVEDLKKELRECLIATDLEKLSVEAYAKYKAEEEAHQNTIEQYELSLDEMSAMVAAERSRPWWKKLLGL